ncbi:hypothetical protein BJX70DRAFT_164497 [Aspergillus crustosus]
MFLINRHGFLFFLLFLFSFWMTCFLAHHLRVASLHHTESAFCFTYMVVFASHIYYNIPNHSLQYSTTNHCSYY